MEKKNTYLGNDGLLHCTVCNEAVEVKFDVPVMGITGHGRMCKCQRELQKQIEERQRQQEEHIKRDRCFPSRIQHEWTFENDNGRNSKMQVAKKYVANWNEMKKNGLGLLLWGSVGSGKSYMAACVANELIKQGADVKMTNFATVLNDLFNCEDKNEYIRSLCRYSLLILDDLGIERNTEYSLENLFNVIDARYVSGKAMIITTNLNLEELKNQKQLSLKRIYDRVLERCIPVCVSENDFRKDNRVEAKVKFGKIINGGKMDEEKYE